MPDFPQYAPSQVDYFANIEKNKKKIAPAEQYPLARRSPATFTEPPLSGPKYRASAAARTSIFVVFLLALLHFASCKKDLLDSSIGHSRPPLLSLPDSSNISGLDLSYIVVIKRTVSFLNGLDADSPGWKRMQAMPETESYSLQVELSHGSLYMLKDNIVVESYLMDKKLPEDKIAKLEVKDGTCTTYNAQENVIASIPAGNLIPAMLDNIGMNYFNTPVDTNLLAADSIRFFVTGDQIIIPMSLANGDESNSIVVLDANTGAVLIEVVYDDDVPEKIMSMVTHEYENGAPRSSSFTFNEYLSDGDVKQTNERREYSNFSLNIY